MSERKNAVTDEMVDAEIARQEWNRQNAVTEVTGRVDANLSTVQVVWAVVIGNLITAVIVGIVVGAIVVLTA